MDLNRYVRRMFALAYERDHGHPPSDDTVRQALMADSSCIDKDDPAPELTSERLRTGALQAGAPKGMTQMVLRLFDGPDGPQQMKVAAASVDKWANNGFRPLTLCLGGPPIAGKSTASAWALVLRMRQLGRPLSTRCWWSFGELASHCAINFSDSQAQVQSAALAPLLVIDNLLAHQDMDARAAHATRGKLIDLLEQRQNFERPTLITTNESLDMLRQEWGEAIASHMRKPRGFFYSVGKCAEKRFPAGDIRARAAKWGDIMPAEAWKKK